MNCNRHPNNHLQAAWNKYGRDCFTYEVLEQCPLSKINERELYWIDNYDSLKHGYNQCYGGAGCRGYKHTEDEIEKMRQVYNPEPVLQYDDKFIFVKRWASASQAGKALNLYSQTIKHCCERRNHVKSVGGYIWIYEKDEGVDNANYYLNKDISFPKEIAQYDLNMNLIRVWDSLYQIGKMSDFSRRSVKQVCDFKRKTHKEYVWRYTDEYSGRQHEIDCKTNYNYNKTKEKKKIGKYSLDGVLICVYDSITSASKNVGLSRSSIKNKCDGKVNQSNDFILKYVM